MARRKTSRRSFLKTSTALAGILPMTHLLEQAGRRCRASGRLCRDLQLPASRHAPDPGRSASREWPWHSSLSDRSRHRIDDALRRRRDRHEPELPRPQRRRNPPLFRERDRSGRRRQARQHHRVRRQSGRRKAGVAQHRAFGRRRADLCQRAPGRTPPARGQLLRRFRGGAPNHWPTAGWAMLRTSRSLRARSARQKRRTPRPAASPSAATIGRTPT